MTTTIAALVLALVLPFAAVAYWFYRVALLAETRVVECWDTIGNLACAMRVQSLTSGDNDGKPDCIGFHCGLDADDDGDAELQPDAV